MAASGREQKSTYSSIAPRLQETRSLLEEASLFIKEKFNEAQCLLNSLFADKEHIAKQQLLFKQLFDLIQKNTAIPEFLASIPEDNEKLKKTQTLLKAIQAGDHTADIFREENCYMYLLYLMQRNKIDFWHGLTVYFYLMTFMESGLDRAKHKVTVEDITDMPWYLYDVCESLPHPPIPDDEMGVKATGKLADEIRQFILTLPPSERWLLRIEFNDFQLAKDGFDDSSRTAHSGKSSMPFLMFSFGYSFLDANHECKFAPSAIYIPSFSVIKYCMQKVSAEPAELAPGFGRLGTEKLAFMHRNNKHPLPICAPAVKSNLTTIDGFRRVTGTIATAIHDLGHWFWMSSLKREFREKVYSTYIPFLDRLKQEFVKMVPSMDKDTIKTIDLVQERLNDFDLYNVSMRGMPNPDDRAYRYLNVAFLLANNEKANAYSRQSELIGTDVNYDNFYFFIEALRHSQFTMTSDEKDFLEKAATFVKTILDQSLKRKVFNGKMSAALSKVAENHAKGHRELMQPENPEQIQWDKWLDILTTKTDSTEIFNELVKHHHDELLTLMTECGLVFYPPFAPLTDEKRAQLIGFVQEQMRLEATARLC